MENPLNRPRKKDFVPMAHRVDNPRDMAHQVDVSERFKTSFIERVEKVGTSRTRKERIKSLADVWTDLNAYMRLHRIDPQDVKDERIRKADKNGKLEKGFIGVSEKGKKLVRDKIPKLNPGVYYLADRKEFLKELDLKLVEESRELMEAVPKKRLEELCDIFEVVYTIMKFREISLPEVTLIAQSRRPLSKPTK